MPNPKNPPAVKRALAGKVKDSPALPPALRWAVVTGEVNRAADKNKKRGK